jgi:mediator of RNA polymerase II transcription subunit 13
LHYLSLNFVVLCAEWNRVIMSIGGDEVCKWPLQIRHSQQDSSTGGLGGMACSSEVGMLSDSALGLAGSGPASPNPSSSFGVRGKTTTANYGKGSGSDLRRQGGQVINQVVAPPEPPKGAFQWVQSISLVSLCVDQSLQIVTTPDGLSISGVLLCVSSSSPELNIIVCTRASLKLNW